jgi:hypothetical protein
MVRRGSRKRKKVVRPDQVEVDSEGEEVVAQNENDAAYSPPSDNNSSSSAVDGGSLAKKRKMRRVTKTKAKPKAAAGVKCKKGDTISCPCGRTTPDNKERMAPCSRCSEWSHTVCNGVFALSAIPVVYTCLRCRVGASTEDVLKARPWWVRHNSLAPHDATSTAPAKI